MPLTQISRSADQRDQRVAGELDHPLGAAHLAGGGVEQRRRDADDRHRDKRLQQRRGKRQHDAAPPGLLVGDEIGRDHRLAVTGTGGVEDAVDERHAEQRPDRAAVGLGGADDARHVAIELGLLGEHPADDAVGRRRRGRRARRAERRCACASAASSAPQPASNDAAAASKHERDRRRALRQSWSGTFHRYLVGERRPVAVLRNLPARRDFRQPLRHLLGHLLRLADVELAARRRADPAHRRPSRRARNRRSSSDRTPRASSDLRLHRRLQRQQEVQRQHRVLGIEFEMVVDRIDERRPSCRSALAKVKKSYSFSDSTLTWASGCNSSRVNSPFFLLLQALGGEGRIHVVEGPGMAHADHRAVRRHRPPRSSSSPRRGDARRRRRRDQQAGQRGSENVGKMRFMTARNIAWTGAEWRPYRFNVMQVPNSSGTAAPEAAGAGRMPATATCTSTTAARFPPPRPQARDAAGRRRGGLPAAAAAIGTSRTVVVTPAAYHTDNAVTLDAIAQLGRAGARRRGGASDRHRRRAQAHG